MRTTYVITITEVGLMITILKISKLHLRETSRKFFLLLLPHTKHVDVTDVECDVITDVILDVLIKILILNVTQEDYVVVRFLADN